MRLFACVTALLACAGCYERDNRPTYIERSSAFEKCTGTWAGTKSYREISDEQRLECTKAVYGN